MEKDDVFYSCGRDCEYLQHTDQHSAIEAHGDAMYPLKIEPGDTVTVYTWRRKELPPVEAMLRFWGPLERLLEAIDDDEYGSPDEGTAPTEAMLKAERAFMAVVREEYVSWGCEIASEEEIDLHKWVQENRPDWLEQQDREG